MTKIRKIALLVFSATLVCISSCGSKDTVNDSDVNEDKLYGSYKVHFDAGKAELTQFVQYRLGGDTGTTIRLTDPSSIVADGEKMQVRDGDTNSINLQGTYYTLLKNVTSPNSTYTYVWTRRDKSVYTNIVTAAKTATVAAPAASAAVSRASGITVTFAGDDIGTSETINCWLNSGVSSGDTSEDTIKSKTITSGKDCVFTAADLAKFRLGTATIQIERERKESAQQGHLSVGGSLWAKYSSAKVNVTIQQ